jgi:hypothetical protein
MWHDLPKLSFQSESDRDESFSETKKAPIPPASGDDDADPSNGNCLFETDKDVRT